MALQTAPRHANARVSAAAKTIFPKVGHQEEEEKRKTKKKNENNKDKEELERG